MPNNPVLTLAQWLSPAYPVGAFAYSHGLEWAVEAQDVTDKDSFAAWLETALRFGAGWTDALFLVAAYNTPDPLEIDQTARSFCASRERRAETVLQGEAFVQVTNTLWNTDLPNLTYPVAIGRAARLCDLPLTLTTQMYLQAFASNLSAAAMRLVPLGQSQGQDVVKTLTPLCAELAKLACETTLENLTSTNFALDIASMKHETQYSRIFRT